MAFAQKLINVSLSLASGNFGGGGNSANLTGLRIACEISTPGGKSPGLMEMVIYGMPLSTMNQLTTLGTQRNLYNQNKITVQAGDAVVGMSTVFQGFISTAFADPQAMPEVCFRISANGNIYDAVKPVPPTSVRGSADVATIMQGLAGQMGYAFENSGVNVKLSNSYFSGSAYSQMLACAEHAGIEAVVDCGTLAIWPAGKSRQGSALLVSPETGMVGYPAFNQGGIIVTVLMQPGIVYGGSIQVQSDLTPANGTWNITNVDYSLESMVPKGKWFVTIEAGRVGSSEVA